MQEEFEKLRGLQEVLAKKFMVLEEIKDIPRTLETKQELLTRGKKTYLEKHERYEKAKEELKNLRASLDQAELDREKSEKRMEEISTQREYEALEKEIKDATAREQSLRKSLLAKEKYCSELEEQLEEQEALIELQEDEVRTETEKKDEELSKKEHELLDLKQQEESLSPGLEESILYKFERIIKNKNGIGIVPVHGLVCQGCHMTLPVQMVNEVRKEEEFRFCPYCSRILFYEHVETSDEQFMTHIAEAETEIQEGSMAEFVDTDEFDDLL
ncbi:MAG: nucleic acid-binding protein [Spirochaetales bacterium]|nr:nucleic acid-binding protein [Spirochaetales bacterium]